MPTAAPTVPVTIYEIQVEGHLEPRRFQAVEGLTIAHHPDGRSTLTAPIPDQAVLYGLLNRLRDMGVTLLAVNRTGGTP
ncbi:MAG: hypothetical protein R3264_02840 [Anaerolineae bacterium]|nr:hypothetical protein [Anaerolineae bacterium]